MTTAHQTWHELETVETRAFIAAREDAHWALQALLAVGYTRLELAKDDSQSNAGWRSARQILAGRSFASEPACHVSLSPEDLALYLHDPDGTPIERFECRGQTLDDAYAWLEQATHPGSTEPRAWPHHFDMGMLLSPESNVGKRDEMSIGVGLSPGDQSSPRPYWYVNPYPSPSGALPQVSLGSWHRDGWIGLTLRADEILVSGDGAAQESLTRRILDRAVALCGDMLRT